MVRPHETRKALLLNCIAGSVRLRYYGGRSMLGGLWSGAGERKRTGIVEVGAILGSAAQMLNHLLTERGVSNRFLTPSLIANSFSWAIQANKISSSTPLSHENVPNKFSPYSFETSPLQGHPSTIRIPSEILNDWSNLANMKQPSSLPLHPLRHNHRLYPTG